MLGGRLHERRFVAPSVPSAKTACWEVGTDWGFVFTLGDLAGQCGCEKSGSVTALGYRDGVLTEPCQQSRR